jgi:hypothetical protein
MRWPRHRTPRDLAAFAVSEIDSYCILPQIMLTEQIAPDLRKGYVILTKKFGLPDQFRVLLKICAIFMQIGPFEPRVSSFRWDRPLASASEFRRCGDRTMSVGLGLLWLAIPPLHRSADARFRGLFGTLEPEGGDARTGGELADCGVDAANSRTQLGRGHSVHASLAPRQTALLCAETYRPRRILGPIRTEREVRASANPTDMAAPSNGPFGIGRVGVDGPLINAGTERSPPGGDRDPGRLRHHVDSAHEIASPRFHDVVRGRSRTRRAEQATRVEREADIRANGVARARRTRRDGRGCLHDTPA